LLSTTSKRLQEKQDAPGQHGQRDGEQRQSKTTSIRPFTVLALFIPLGYAVSWVTGGRTENTASASEDGFVKYTLAIKEDVSATSAIFTLTPMTTSSTLASGPGLERAIRSVQIKQPQLQIARNYTILPSPGSSTEELRFLIRRERKGEVSGYLHRLPLGSKIELRGPVMDYVWPDGVDEVVFLAGGTGIVPALQVAEGLAGQAHVHILCANRSRQDCAGGFSDTPSPKGWFSWLVRSGDNLDSKSETTNESSPIVSIVKTLKHLPNSASTTPDTPKLRVDYFVDEENIFIQPDQVRQLLLSAQPANAGKVTGKRLLLISGPEGFINYWAGPKQWMNGREIQGPLGGVLSTFSLAGWEVVKL